MPVGMRHGDFFAQKKVGMGTQSFCCVNGVMVGDGDEGHASGLEALVEFSGVVVGFPANFVEHRRAAHARGYRVNMKVASHVTMISQ